jgi:hypothetical protein
MKIKGPSKFRFAWLLILINALFWLTFAVLFATHTVAYSPHQLKFEEVTPSYIFFGRALQMIDSGTGVGIPPLLIEISYTIQKPSSVAARTFFRYFHDRGITVEHTYGGISIGGYYLLLVCLFSFLQWYLVGFLIDYLSRRLTEKAGGAYDKS